MSAAAVVALGRVAGRIRSDRATSRLTRGAIWNLLANASIHGAGVLGAVIVARQLGPEAFGKFGIVNTTIGMASTVGALGVGISATKYVAEYGETNPVRARRLLDLTMLVSVLSGLLGSAAIYFLAAPIAARVLHAAEIAAELRIAAPMVLLSIAGGAQIGILSGLERFLMLAKVNVVRAALTVPLTAGLTAAWGLRGAVLSLTAASLVGLVATSLALRRAMPRSFPTADYVSCWREWRMLTGFSLPSVLTTISTTPVQWALSAWLVRSPNGFFEMGMYAAANQVRTLVTYLPSALGQPALAMLSRESAAGQGRFAPLFQKTLLLGVGLTCLAGIPVLAGSPWILSVYHPGLSGHWVTVSLLILSGIVQVPGWIATVAVSSIGRMWTCLFLQLIWTALTLASAAWFVPRFGALGLAAALMIGCSTHTAATLLVVRNAVRSHGDTL
jgi:O-antigen/teichoic acid export membrane protein